MKNKFVKYASLAVTACMSLFLTVHATEINYTVTLPKEITLDENKESNYSIGVAGEIPEYKILNIVPVNEEYEEQYNFYMKDLAEKHKENVLATIKQSKTNWSPSDVASSYTETNNSVTAKSLSAGDWKGIFHMKISLLMNPNHEHKYTSSITKEPTCTEEGERTYTCECGDSYTEPIPKIPHNYVPEITKEPTCTEEGEKTYICEECGDTYTEKIPPTGIHTYTENITKEPTCTEKGTKTYTCECGESYTEEIPATGHNYVSEVTKEATCTEDGVITYTCTKCGDTYTETIPAHGHEFEEGECIHCGEKDPNYHDWKPLWFEHNTPATKSAIVSISKSSSRTSSCSFSITVPDWYPRTIEGYTYSASLYIRAYTLGSVSCTGISGISTSSASSTSPTSKSASGKINLQPGKTTTISGSASGATGSVNSGGSEITITFPTLEPYLDKTQHMCRTHGEIEEHFSTCTDETKDEYYFCSGCGQQFRHKCVFSTDECTLSGTCGESYYAYPCIKDFYDETGKLFSNCSNTFNVKADISHEFHEIERRIKPTNSAGNASNYISVSTNGKSTSSSSYLKIDIPEWIEGNVEHTIKHTVSIPSSDQYQVTYLSFGPTNGSGSYNQWKHQTFVSISYSGTERVLQLRPGSNYLNISVNASAVNTGTLRQSIDVPDVLLDRELITYHICSICNYKEKHYTSCTDDTKDEYYFCEVCGQQFRHRCKFDDSDISFANCEGGDVELICIDDYYDTTHDLFETCGETKKIHFNGLGHDFQPYVVQVEPVVTINPNSSESKYTFTKSSGSTYDTYRGNIAIASGDFGSSGSSTSMILEITLPNNFNGTYSLPISYSISSSAFTKVGYRMTVYAPGLSYDLGYADTTTKTTSGTVYATLKAGVNKLSFSTNASCNLSSWQTGTNGGPSGSVTFSVPHMPFYIFDGTEVHKCTRCGLEVNHENEFRITEKVESTCTEKGYIDYICDICGFTYTEILPLNSDNHTDEDEDYICDDCGKDLKTCEKFGHIITSYEEKKTVTPTVSGTGGWYEDEDGWWQIPYKANTNNSGGTLTITYTNIPVNELVIKRFHVGCANVKNGVQWSTSCTGAKQVISSSATLDEYEITSSTVVVTIVAKSATMGSTGFELWATFPRDFSSDSITYYKCTRCGRVETYDFSSEVSTSSLDDISAYSFEDGEMYIEDIEDTEKTPNEEESSDVSSEETTEEENSESTESESRNKDGTKNEFLDTGQDSEEFKDTGQVPEITILNLSSPKRLFSRLKY